MASRIRNSEIKTKSRDTKKGFFQIFFLTLFFIAALPTKADNRTYSSIAEFISTLKEAKLLEVHGSGTLTKDKSIFHAVLAEIEGKYWIQQIFILKTAKGGEFTLVDQSKKMEYMGGTGRWQLRQIVFRNDSVYFAFSDQWQECTDTFISQFKVQNDQLILVGRESTEENTKKNLTVNSSANMLTGEAYSISGSIDVMFDIEKNRDKVKKSSYKIKREILPFSEFDATPWKSPLYKKHPIC